MIVLERSKAVFVSFEKLDLISFSTLVYLLIGVALGSLTNYLTIGVDTQFCCIVVFAVISICNVHSVLVVLLSSACSTYSLRCVPVTAFQRLIYPGAEEACENSRTTLGLVLYECHLNKIV